MSEQQSGKSGVVSTSRKEAGTKHPEGPMPPTQPVAGAFGAEDRPPASELEHATSGAASAVRAAHRTKPRRRRRRQAAMAR